MYDINKRSNKLKMKFLNKIGKKILSKSNSYVFHEKQHKIYKKKYKKASNIYNEIIINRINQNVLLLRNRVAADKKINIVFMVPGMMFIYKELYDLFDSDPLFNVCLVLTPHIMKLNEPPTESSKLKYYQLLDSLKKRNYNVIEGYDFSNDMGIDLETNCRPDIIFYILPHMRAYPKNLTINNLPHNILYAYIPYGEVFQPRIDKSAYNFGWVEQAWKRFCNTPEYLKTSTQKSNIGSSNVIITGSARMDGLINYSPQEQDYKWIFNGSEKKKRIIWAPHHSLPRPNLPDKFVSSTFDKNYVFFYEYAKNHPEIEWVVRPHPILKEVLSTIDIDMKLDGIIDENFTEEYWSKWNELPNARIHEEADYMDLFATADAMITDCISFTSEYLFTEKPGLYLETDGYIAEGYDKEIKKGWYCTNGSNYKKIEEFITQVVMGENDSLKEKRKEVFNKYLNYNAGKASESIYKYIKETFK